MITLMYMSERPLYQPSQKGCDAAKGVRHAQGPAQGCLPLFLSVMCLYVLYTLGNDAKYRRNLWVLLFQFALQTVC